MSISIKPTLFIVALCGTLLTGCYIEDPGPRQGTDRAYSVVDFDRLEIGSGLHVNVHQAEFYSVEASGDRRNIEDLIVEKEGGTLVIRYRNFRERRHDTFIDITTPELVSVTFSGGADTKVSGFTSEENFNLNLSGGSVCQLNVNVREIDIVLSGGSYLNLRGEGISMNADISGASALKAFAFPLSHGDIRVSGASDAQVTVSDVLNIVATGASHLTYRGDPSVSSEVSGASSINQEFN